MPGLRPMPPCLFEDSLSCAIPSTPAICEGDVVSKIQKVGRMRVLCERAPMAVGRARTVGREIARGREISWFFVEFRRDLCTPYY